MQIKIYTLSDPRTPNTIRYVGKTKRKLSERLNSHISQAKKAEQKLIKSNHNYNWIISLSRLSLKPVILELDVIECDDNSKE